MYGLRVLQVLSCWAEREALLVLLQAYFECTTCRCAVLHHSKGSSVVLQIGRDNAIWHSKTLTLFSFSPKHFMILISLFALICRYLFVHLQAHEARQGHSYCSQQGCERIKITAQMYPGGSWSCAPNPFSQRPAASQHPVFQHQALPCRACGAPQV